MRKLIESAFVSLDGVVESAPQWAAPYLDAAENRNAWLAKLMDADALLFGRTTFELFHAIGTHRKGDAYFDRIHELPKFVASTSLREVPWGATLLSGDTAEQITKMKQRDGKNIVKYGNGGLDKTLVEQHLIDEFHFTVFPVVVGQGRRLFEGIDTSRFHLKLASTHPFSNGLVTLNYVRV
jgi:dihydrofolate reductase